MAAAGVQLPEINQNSSIVQQQSRVGFSPEPNKQNYNTTHPRDDSTQNGFGNDEEGDGDGAFSPQSDHEDQQEQKQRGAGALLNRYDVDRFRKSYLNIIYVAMLEEGYNKSYKELFNLVTSQVAKREEAGPNSFLWFKPLLRDNRQHLETLSYFLCRSEEAQREGNLARVYGERLMLAEYFEQNSFDELATHFYKSCLRISNDIEDEGLTHAQANCFMGQDVFSKGETEEALEYFENYYELSRDQEWTNEHGVSLVQDACVKLLRVYIKIGDQCLSKGDDKTAVAYFRKAQDFAQASGVAEEEATTQYRLACSLQQIGANTEAISLFTSYRDKCYHIGDFKGVGRAVEHISSAMVKQGNKQEAIDCLSEYGEEARKSGHLVSYSEACSSLAQIQNSIGNFEDASAQSEQSFNTLLKVTENRVDPGFDRVMTQFGICRGNAIAFSMFNVLENTDEASIAELISWKNARTPPDFAKHDAEKVVVQKTAAGKAASKKDLSVIEAITTEITNPMELREIGEIKKEEEENLEEVPETTEEQLEN